MARDREGKGSGRTAHVGGYGLGVFAWFCMDWCLYVVYSGMCPCGLCGSTASFT